MSRLGASAFFVWGFIDITIKFPILGAVVAAIAPAWAAAAALPLCLGLCGGVLLRRRGDGDEAGGERRGSGWEMAGVVELGLVSPALAPLAGITVGLVCIDVVFSVSTVQHQSRLHWG